MNIMPRMQNEAFSSREGNLCNVTFLKGAGKQNWLVSELYRITSPGYSPHSLTEESIDGKVLSKWTGRSSFWWSSEPFN